MNNEQFDRLVDRLQIEAKEQPKVYQTKVAALAALGYGYIMLIAIVLCVMLVGLGIVALKAHVGYLVFKALIPIAAIMWLLGKSLCVKFHRPEGLPVNANDAPELFRTIEEIRQSTRGPKIHTVLINTEFNCCITQQPRLGIFGWHENCLVLGFPFMQCMSLDEFRAVLAHEMGHLSSDHGKFGSWIYGVRSAWVRIYSELHTETILGNLLLKNFCKWYTQIFDAYSAVLMREHELEADRLAARVAGPEVAARALINTAVRNSYLAERFWPKVFDGAKESETPPPSIYTTLREMVHSQIEPTDASCWLQQTLQTEPRSGDSHPPLAKRLEAIGFNEHGNYDEDAISHVVALKNDAASELFGTELAVVQRKLEAAWLSDVEISWIERYHYFANGRAELARLDVIQDTGQELSKSDKLMLARWTSELRDKKEAIQQYESLLDQDASDVNLNNEYGHLLLECEDERGIQYLETAMSANPMLGLSNCEAIFRFLKKLHRDEEAQKYYDRALEYIGMLGSAMLERNGVAPSDKFEDHALPQEKIDEICDKLRQYSDVCEAHLVRKSVEHLPDEPYLIVTVKIDSRWYRLEAGTKERQVLNMLAAQVSLPSAGCIVSTTVAPKNLKAANKQLRTALIFSAKNRCQRERLR